MSGALRPQFVRMSAWHVDTADGAVILPADVVGFEDPDFEDLEPLDEPELRYGWYAQWHMPGYLDCTPWIGPYETEPGAMLEFSDLEDVCILCFDACWETVECPEADHLARRDRLMRDSAEQIKEYGILRHQLEALFCAELEDEPCHLGSRVEQHWFEGGPAWSDYPSWDPDIEYRTIIGFMDPPSQHLGEWELTSSYRSSGECECPWCYGEEPQEGCDLCEGDGSIYLGDEWYEAVYQRGRLT